MRVCFASMNLRLVLPLPPSLNKLYSRSRTGQVFLNPKMRKFREDVAALVGGKHPRVDGRFRSKVTLHPASNRSFDGDNREKALWDALEAAGVIENDKHNFDCHRVVAEVRPPNGMCIVEIWKVE